MGRGLSSGMSAEARLLGPPAIALDGARLVPPPSHGATIVLYLAWRDAWTPRDEVAALLWGDRPDAVARRNLRQALFRLRAGPLAAALTIEPTRLRFAGTSDLVAFRAAVDQEAWPAAVDAWCGPFLSAWSLPGAREVERWIDAARAELAPLRRASLAALAERLASDGRPADAARLWGVAWREDVLDEAAARAQAELLRRAGRDGEAARELRAFAAAFERELGFPPEMLDLGAASTKGADAAPERRSPQRPGPEALPADPTPFVGRSRELDALATVLAGDGVRWVTVVGIGGAGKTRLALEAARRRADGGGTVAWAPVGSLDAAEDVPSALARAWGLAPPGEAGLDAVADAVGRNGALLVIDDADPVAAGVVAAVTSLLEACPGLKVLITSRIALGAGAERRFPLAGMAYEAGAGRSDAAELFLAAAARRGRTVDLESDEPAIDAICAELGGLPLALELMAGWTDVLSPRELHAELGSGLDALDAGAPGAPPRQGGLRSVLDAAYERMPSEARTAFVALAPFRGGFDLAAARAVGATPQALRELSRASLLQRQGDRFERHPLVRRHARERAADDPQAWRRARARHAEHYLRRMREHNAALLRAEDVSDARSLFLASRADLRETVLWTVEGRDVRSFVDAYHGYSLFTDAFAPGTLLPLIEEGLRRSHGAIHEHLVVSELQYATTDADTGLDRSQALRYEARLRGVLREAERHGDALLTFRAHRRLARLRLRDGDRNGGLAHARAAISSLRDARNAWGWVGRTAYAGGHRTRATARMAAGDYRGARSDLLRSIALFLREGAAPHKELGRLVRLDVAFGRWHEATNVARAWEACLGADPPASARVAALLARARVALARGDGEEVRRACVEGLRAAGQAPGPLRAELQRDAHGVLGHLALLQGALDVAETRLEGAGDAPVNGARRACLLLAQGRADEAIAELRAALERVPYSFLQPFTFGFAGSLLAIALAESGDRRRARRIARRVLRRAAEARQAPEILRGLVALTHVEADRPAADTDRRLRWILRHPATDATSRWLAAGRTPGPLTPAAERYDGRQDGDLVDRAERALSPSRRSA